MNEQLRESLSALMDDEAEPMEVQRVLKAMQQDPTLLATWQRMQIASGALRSEMPYVGSGGDFVSIAARVAVAVQDEPHYDLHDDLHDDLHGDLHDSPVAEHAKANVYSLFSRPLASLAMAATVAAVTVVGVLQYQRFSNAADSLGAPSVAENVSEMSNVRIAAVPNLNTRAANDGLSRPVAATFEQATPQQRLSLAKSIHQVQSGKAAAQQRLIGYMQRHAEHAVFNNNQGIMPMARVVNASHVQY